MDKKIAINRLQALAKIVRAGGAVASSEWTNGSGRFKSRRPVPPFATFVERGWRGEIPAGAPEAAVRLFNDRPRVQKVVAVADMAAALAALAERGINV